MNERLEGSQHDTKTTLLNILDESDLLNKQAIVMPGYQCYLSPIMGTFISSFVLPSVFSSLILASWVFSHFFFL
jgi:hypothetical protein